LAKAVTDSIREISDFLCERLGLEITILSTLSNVYHEILYKNRDALPAPNECHFSSDATWHALIWFYSHSYFPRLWIIQEINASTRRVVPCGRQQIEWDHVDLVAGYIIMDTAFSNRFGFSKTHCWWTATVTTERMRKPKNWLFMLYLASNFACQDGRDMIYGLRGLMVLPEPSEQATLLNLDYDKSTVEVFRDSVEAALLHFPEHRCPAVSRGRRVPVVDPSLGPAHAVPQPIPLRQAPALETRRGQPPAVANQQTTQCAFHVGVPCRQDRIGLPV
jgi:hypothetical protein